MKSKLAFLCSSQSWGGLEMNHARSAKWLIDLGYEAIVFCVENSPIEQFAEELNVPVQHIVPHKKYYDFKRAKVLARILKTQHFTHLVIRSTSDMSITASVKQKLGDRIHTSYFQAMQLGVKKTNILHTIRFNHLDLWVCPLQWLQEQVRTMTRFKNECIVVHSGIELEKFNTNLSKSEAREILDLPANELIFGLIGRFDPQKGQLLLLKAMELTKNSTYHVLLLGEPTLHEGDSYYQEMLDVISKTTLKGRVHIKPFMKDVTVFFNAVDWFVMATKAETFGMVTIESLACGTPVLGSNAGGTPEILNNEAGGKLFTTQDPQSLANAIDEIIEKQIKFDAVELRKIAANFDHRVECQMIEKHLHLSKN